MKGVLWLLPLAPATAAFVPPSSTRSHVCASIRAAPQDPFGSRKGLPSAWKATVLGSQFSAPDAASDGQDAADDDLRSSIDSLLRRLSRRTGDEDEYEDEGEAGEGRAAPRVYLIGTGLSPRASDLPLSTLSVLSRADVVLHDSLSLPPDEIRRVVSPGCLVRSVGKRGDDASSVRQDEIDGLLVGYALGRAEAVGNDEGEEEDEEKVRPARYPTVVRLKGGDPFLFGRSRTEIDALRSRGVPYRVVPNLSSAVAGPHLAGIPLTDPVLKADSFAVFSGTNAEGKGLGSDDGGRDWDKVGVDTLVFLMIGKIDKLEELCRRLAGSGQRWTEGTECAVVREAGRPGQRVWRGLLGTIVDVIREDLGKGVVTVSPAIFVVGRTASLDLLS